MGYLKNKSIKFFASRSSKGAGFTLIEMIVVISVIAIISVFTISYSHTSQTQLVVVKDQAKIASVLQKAKEMSLATLSDAGISCGYGVHFSSATAPNSVVIFKNESPATGPNTLPICLSLDHSYQPSGLSSDVEKIYLDSDIRFKTVSANDIFFVPPDPTVFINNSSSTPESFIEIMTVDGLTTKTLKVNNFGQITIH